MKLLYIRFSHKASQKGGKPNVCTYNMYTVLSRASAHGQAPKIVGGPLHREPA